MPVERIEREELERRLNTRVRNGVVVMIDALGVSNFSSLDTLRFLDKWRSIIDTIIYRRYRFREFMISFNENLGNLHNPEVITFGDTIILSWDVPLLEPDYLLIPVGILLRPIIRLSIESSVPIRGAIGIGEYIHYYPSTIVGPAVSQAAKWYEKGEWLGIIASIECGRKIELVEDRNRESGTIDRFYIKYNVPLNNGTSREMWVLSWPQSYLLHGNEMQTRNATDNFNRGLASIQRLDQHENKYTNTTSFYNWFSINARIQGEDLFE